MDVPHISSLQNKPIFEDVIEENPEHALSHRGLRDSYIELGKRAKAKKFDKMYDDLTPDFSHGGLYVVSSSLNFTIPKRLETPGKRDNKIENFELRIFESLLRGDIP